MLGWERWPRALRLRSGGSFERHYPGKIKDRELKIANEPFVIECSDDRVEWKRI